MDQSHIPPNKTINDNVIAINFKDEFEDFDFRPITKGLGIQTKTNIEQLTHRGARKTAFPLLNRNIRPISNKQAVVAVPLHRQHKDMSKSDPQVADYYSKIQKETPKERIKEVIIASKSDRASAWIVDVIVIMLVLIFMLISFSIFSGIKLTEIMSTGGTTQTWMFFIFIFSIFYIFYFTILDSTETIGKNLFKLKVRSIKENITITESLFRSTLSLLFLYMMGVGLWFDIHSKITNTKTIKNV